MPSDSFFKDSITLIPKPDKESTRKEKYRLISLMNIDVNIFKKYKHTKCSRIQKGLCVIIS